MQISINSLLSDRGGRRNGPLTSFDILFVPMLQVVSTMRRFVESLYERILKDDSTSAQMALVTHELLENAIRFNSQNCTRLQIYLTREAGAESRYLVEIRTRNHASQENIRSASDLIARVRDAQDPDLLYLQMMRRSSEQIEGAGLGLVRIRAETEMTIDVNAQGDEIEVVARTSVGAGGAP